MSTTSPFSAIIADSSRLGSVMLERLLAPLLDVTVCADNAALDLALRQQPAALMIAHQWPGLESLLAGLRQKNPALAILLMASPESDAARLAKLSSQFDAGVIYRPYELRQVMRELLLLLSVGNGDTEHPTTDSAAVDIPDPLDMVERDQAFCRRHQLPHALLALRIDEYESLAGQLGQEVVDQSEARLFTLISNSLRREDHICQRGAGGLIVSLPGTPVAGARVLAHRLCQQVEEADLGGSLELVAGIHFLANNSDESIDDAIQQARATGELASRADHLPVLVSEAACEALDQLAPPVLQEEDAQDSDWQEMDALFDDDVEQRRQAMQRLAALLRRLDENTRMTLIDELLLASSMPDA